MQPLYGYQYLFNPHRDIRETSTRQYHKRAFERLNKVVHSDRLRKTFIVADYANKQHATFISDPILTARFIQTQLQSYDVCNYSVEVVRFWLNDNEDRHGFLKVSKISLTESCRLNNVSISRLLDEQGLRGMMYRVTASMIFGSRSVHTRIWAPGRIE